MLKLFAKAKGAVPSLEAELAALTNRLDNLPPPAADDFDPAADTKAREDREALEKRRVAVVGALERAKRVAADGEEAERIANDEREHAAALKRIETDMAKLLPEITKDGEALAGKLTRFKSLKDEAAKRNATRGKRAFIRDMEFELRKRPGREIKRSVEKYMVWVDADGNAVPETVYDRQRLKYVRNPAVVGQAEREHVIREGGREPDTAPESFVTAIRLYDLAGAQIWPPVQPVYIGYQG